MIRERLFKALAVLVMFLISFSAPIFVVSIIQSNAKDVRIKSNIKQIDLWAEVYQIQNESYLEMDNNEEMKRIILDINLSGGDGHIYINKNGSSFCATSKLRNKKSSWCVDSAGYSGVGNCSQDKVKCQ
jgi:hypothetical protein